MFAARRDRPGSGQYRPGSRQYRPGSRQYRPGSGQYRPGSRCIGRGPDDRRGFREDARCGSIVFRQRSACLTARSGTRKLPGVTTVVFGSFEWDADKATENERKHGVTFEEAASVFLDLDYILSADPIHPDRFAAIGFSRLARLLFVVHCEPDDRIRIISARRATPTETLQHDRRRSN
jgi:uncharacterized protein